MTATIDLTDDGHDGTICASVLAVLYVQGQRLYAVTAMVDGAPWYALVHEQSTALISVND